MELWPMAAYAGVRKLFQLTSDVLHVRACACACACVTSTCRCFRTRLFVIDQVRLALCVCCVSVIEQTEEGLQVCLVCHLSIT